ncbi:MAG TPA: hypothetical protein VGE00_04450 [Gammaproteobacteria bacterium]
MYAVKIRRPLKQLAAAGLIGICAASFAVYAAPGGTPGPNPNPGGGGGGGGGGGTAEPPDFGDLFILLRDADGIPILTPESCEQSLAAPGVPLPAIAPYPACTPAADESCIIPVDPATCGVVLGYETYTQEVEFGRTNVARSPTTVLEQQLEDAVIKLSIADCVTRDSAGRLAASTVGADEVVTTATIDSPLQSLAIYKQLMLKGYLGAEGAPLALPGNALDLAAVGVGAAADKGGKVTVDMVVYLNQFLGLNDPSVPTFVPKKCIQVKDEVKGVIQLVEKCFLNYGATGANYQYNRGANFGALPSPAYIPAGNPQEGWSEYLIEDATTVTDPLDRYALRFMVAEGPTLDAVPELMGNKTMTASSIVGFAQAADDTRAVIDYLHSWPLPELYATPLTCAASGETHYDLSLSEESGLQVPVRMVAGTEGREYTVSVANAGPDAASGTVELSAVDADGVSLPGFPRTFSFTLAAGTSTSWTELFTIAYATTITWTATLTAPFDVNPANNSVTETTLVIGAGGTGGGTGGGGTGGGGGNGPGGGIR